MNQIPNQIGLNNQNNQMVQMNNVINMMMNNQINEDTTGLNNPIFRMSNPMNHLPNNNSMMNNNMINLNPEIENIFDSNYSPFVFSLDKLNIYYEKDININKNFPNFSVGYDKKLQILLGTENPDTFPDLYKLSGENKFRIKSLELYEIVM